MRLLATAILSVLAGALTSTAAAATYTLTAARDSTLAAGAPTTNFGTGTTLIVKGSSTDNYLSVVGFTLPTIPFDEVITEATFSFTSIDPGGNPGTYAFSAHRVTDVWTESTVNWSNTAADYVATPLASASGVLPGATVNLNVKSLVDAWYAGTSANNGFIINSSVQARIDIHSRESTGLKPTLTIVTTNIPVPTSQLETLVHSDPFNLSVNPKRVPGAVLRQVGTATNTGRGTADGLSISIPVPANTRLFVGDLAGVGTGPVIFTQGATSSGTTFSYTTLSSTTDAVAFSSDNGANFTYTPVPDASGYDAFVTHVRVRPSGTFAGADGTATPSFKAEIRVQTK